MSQELTAQPAREFADAAHALAEPTPVWGGGICRWQESIYDRLRSALTAKSQRATVAAGSRLPCRIDVLSLLHDIDTTTAVWWPDAHNTRDRLAKMREQHWTPQDVERLTAYTTKLQQWTAGGAELLGDRMTSIALRKPCPSCGQLWTHRRAGAENVRCYALRASDTGAQCLACNATWTPDQYRFLARLLGVTPTI